MMMGIHYYSYRRALALLRASGDKYVGGGGYGFHIFEPLHLFLG